MTGLKESTEMQESDPQIQRNKLNKFGRKILRKRVGAQSSRDNTGKRILKVSSFFIPTITDDIQGIADRVLYYGEQAISLLSDAFKKKFS